MHNHKILGILIGFCLMSCHSGTSNSGNVSDISNGNSVSHITLLADSVESDNKANLNNSIV